MVPLHLWRRVHSFPDLSCLLRRGHSVNVVSARVLPQHRECGHILGTCQQSFLAAAFCQLRYTKCSLSSLLSLSAAQPPSPFISPCLSLPWPHSFSSTSSFHAVRSPTVLVTLCWSFSTLCMFLLFYHPPPFPEMLTVLSPPNFSSSHFNLSLPFPSAPLCSQIPFVIFACSLLSFVAPVSPSPPCHLCLTCLFASFHSSFLCYPSLSSHVFLVPSFFHCLCFIHPPSPLALLCELSIYSLALGVHRGWVSIFNFFFSTLSSTFSPSLYRLAGCYTGPVARGWSPGADVIPGRSGGCVHRHEAAILRPRRLHALCCRSVHTGTVIHTHHTTRGSEATHSLCAKIHTRTIRLLN